MPRRSNTAIAQIYQLKVTLRGSKPPIGRRLEVPSNMTLPEFHHTLQMAMGWAGGHLHLFTIHGMEYGVPDPDDWGEVRNEKPVKLNQFVDGPKFKFTYEYDFGDGWEHILLVEKVLPLDPNKTYPRCVTGKRACPPEDCGGIWGYASFLEAIGDPNHPEHDEMIEWIGGAFDAEAFDCATVNESFKWLGAEK